MSGGFGGGGWGSVPWGGSALEFENPPVDFDVFCFFDSPASMGSILLDPDVSTIDAGSQFTIDLSNDLIVASGGAVISTATASLQVTKAIPATWTLEYTIFVDDIPVDFNDLVNRHIFIGVTSAVGVCAGFFLSAAGMAYTGGVRYTPDLVIDSTVQTIPGSGAYMGTGRSIVVRIAVESTTGTLYLYVTDLTALPISGHVLRAVLPTIDATDLAVPPVDRVTVGARGTVLQPTEFRLDELCLSSNVLIPNLAPIADAGIDRSIQACEVIRLDGSASFDPEGSSLLYRWQLIDAPQTSIYTVAGSDGFTVPIDASGFTDKFHSPFLGTLIDQVEVGDVLLLDGVARSITLIGSDINGYFLRFAVQNIPDSLVDAPFRVLRQRGIYNADQVVATFLPDIVGFYRFELIVSDGLLPSAPAVVVVNVLEALLPRGVVPDVSFLFAYLSDFWGLVEDRERVTTLWSGVAQVASAELLSLWQHDYAKSLRDIQRQFTRKWLHYDPLLPEPIPELTKIRAVWGGIYSNPVDVTFYGGGYAVGGTGITLTSPIWDAPVTITFSNASVFSQAALVAELSSRLTGVDSRFRVRAVLWSSPKSAVHIWAPFAFTITAVTMPTITNLATGQPDTFFKVGSMTSLPGSSDEPISDVEMRRDGVAVGTNTYRVFARLTDVVENDFLCIEGVAYRIAQLIEGTAEQTDIVLKESLPATPSRVWSIASYITSELLDFWNGLVSVGDPAFLEITDPSQDIPSSAQFHVLHRVLVVGINEALPNYLPVTLGNLPVDLASTERTVRFAKLLRRRYVPISSLVLDVPTVSATIVIGDATDEESVLRRNIDYTIEPVRQGTGLHFVVDGPDVWEAADPPDRLWAEFTYLDNRPTIEQNFGIPVEFTLDKLAELPADLDYLSAVRGLWYAYFNGPTLTNLRIGTQILLGLPFAEEAGVIEEIRTDFSPTLGRILIRDTANSAIVRSYTYPRILDLETNPETGVDYVVGDTVSQFAPLVEGAEIVDYVKDPRWFQGILNQGVFSEVEKYFRFLVRVDSAAFNLAAILAVRDFVLKVKPTYTYPMFVVESGNDRIDDINVDDTMTMEAALNLTDTPCGGRFGSSTIFDDFKGDGTIYNQFDANADPFDPAPVFPTSDTPVLWAFDKVWLCPEDQAIAIVSTRFNATLPITVGQCFLVGEPADILYGFVQSAINFPLGVSPALSLISPDPNEPTVTVNTAGTLTRATVRTFGDLGGNPNSFLLVVRKNGIEVASVPFTLGEGTPHGTAHVTLSTAVAVTDVLSVGLRVPSTGYTYPWTSVQIRIYQEDAIDPWTVGMSLPAATYNTMRPLGFVPAPPPPPPVVLSGFVEWSTRTYRNDFDRIDRVMSGGVTPATPLMTRWFEFAQPPQRTSWVQQFRYMSRIGRLITGTVVPVMAMKTRWVDFAPPASRSLWQPPKKPRSGGGGSGY